MHDQSTQFHPIESDADWHAQGWRDESEPITAAAELSALVTIRLDPASARLVAKAAQRAGVTRSEFVRRAALAAATDLIDQAPDDTSSTGDSGPLASSV
jgi:hypothetical protein